MICSSRLRRNIGSCGQRFDSTAAGYGLRHMSVMARSGMHRLELSQKASEIADDPLSARQTSAWLTSYLEQLSRPGAALVIQTAWRSHQARVFFFRWEQQYAGTAEDAYFALSSGPSHI